MCALCGIVLCLGCGFNNSDGAVGSVGVCLCVVGKSCLLSCGLCEDWWVYFVVRIGAFCLQVQ